jgi:protein involved in polysaccharide export with SLBB domain
VYTLAEGMRLFDLLFAAGGIGDPDFRRDIYLYRADLMRMNGTALQKYVIPIDLKALLQGDSEPNLELQSQDEVVIYAASEFEEDQFVTVRGLVRKPDRYKLLENMTLDDLLVQAGGLKETAFPLYVEVARASLDAKTGDDQLSQILKIPLEQASRVPLQDEDLVFVRRDPDRRPHRVVVLKGEVVFPGQYALKRENERVSELIARAGGLRETASLENCKFYRGQAPVRVDLEGALKGRTEADIILVVGDSIYVPPKNHTVEVKGAVLLPGIVQWKPNAKANYYIDAVGGFEPTADRRRMRIVRGNGFVLPASKRLLPDPVVPPGSTLIVPQKVPPASKKK